MNSEEEEMFITATERHLIKRKRYKQGHGHSGDEGGQRGTPNPHPTIFWNKFFFLRKIGVDKNFLYRLME